MVNCYLIQVTTGKEEIYKKHAYRFAEIQQLPCKLILPRRELTIKRQGKFSKVVKPIFPSYIFWETEKPDPEVRRMLRHVPGFIRLVKDEFGKLIPLSEGDRTIVASITSDGEVAKRSLVFSTKTIAYVFSKDLLRAMKAAS
ncbi:MAG: hypothetical protein PF495_04595 [Spirochaetales bacterium]|jgi:transcriptional antiterminator NusG|nr:hypothetical protein [Spirochaetales bacterium]